MSAERIAQALDGRKEGNGWRCECPIHTGHHLVVKESREDKTLLWCHTGATFPEIAKALEEQGLWG